MSYLTDEMIDEVWKVGGGPMWSFVFHYKNKCRSLQHRLDHAEGLLKRIREHEHSNGSYYRTSTYLDDHPGFDPYRKIPTPFAYASGIKAGHECCAVIASEPYKEHNVSK